MGNTTAPGFITRLYSATVPTDSFMEKNIFARRARIFRNQRRRHRILKEKGGEGKCDKHKKEKREEKKKYGGGVTVD